MAMCRKVIFLGSSRRDLQAFPEGAKDDLGQMLWDVQNDLEPLDWNPCRQSVRASVNCE